MTEQVERTKTWCPTCNTLQCSGDDCPGELLATGPERYGWRLLAETSQGPEVYGVLVAPAGSVWRARILTFPNVLWVIPYGGTMKWFAPTPAEVERIAIEFIKGHCKNRGYTLRKEVPPVESAAVDREQDTVAAGSAQARASERQLHTVRIRYSVSGTTIDAETDDLSEGGVFIRAEQVLPVGTGLKMFLDTEEFGIPLQGAVRWIRERREEGRPQGMGVRLVNPHPRYLHYVRQYRNRKPDTDEKAGSYEIEEWAGPERG